MQTSTKKVCALALGLIIVGGGGLINAHNPFERNTAPEKSKTTNAAKADLMDKYSTLAREAMATGITAKPSKAPESEKELVLEEDFSLFTDGTEEEPGAYVSTYIDDGNSFIDEALTHTPGWWGIGVMQAGGTAALAHPGLGGVLTSGPMNMYGNLTVSFRVKAREGNPEGKGQALIVSAICGNDYDPVIIGNFQILNDIKPEEGWKEYNLNFQVPNKGDDTRIQFNGATYSPAGFLLDDIKVTRDYDFCLQPLNLRGYGFDYDGFTAAWDANAENNSYLLTVKQVKEISDEDAEGSYDFNDITPNNLPGGIEASLGEEDTISDNEGFEGSRGLRLDREDSVTLDCGGGRIYSLSLFINPFIDKDAEEPAIISIEGYQEGEYEWFADIVLKNIGEGGTTLSLEEIISKFAFTYSKIRLSAEDFEDGDYCVIDQIDYMASPATEETLIFEDKPVEGTSLRIDGLDPAAEYYFAVEGVKNENLKSGRTPFFHALGLPAPVATSPKDIEKRGAYTAEWNAAPKAIAYDVVNYQRHSASADEENHVVIIDNFDNATGDSEYLDGTSFDGIADNKGWMSTAGLVTNGCIGSFMKPLLTPELSLGNNGGKFTVKMKIQAFPDEIVVVQSMTEYQMVDLWEIYNDRDPYAGMVEHEMTLTFGDGVEHERLMIYGMGYGTVLIDTFEVTQDLKEGDVIYKFEGVEQVNAETLSHRFTGLTNTPDFTYTYNVSAYGEYFGEIYTSDKSSDILVDLNATDVEEILSEAAARRGIKTVDGGVEVTLSETATVNVYTASGMVVITKECAAGVNRIDLPAPGVYIVNNGRVSTKVIIR